MVKSLGNFLTDNSKENMIPSRITLFKSQRKFTSKLLGNSNPYRVDDIKSQSQWRWSSKWGMEIEDPKECGIEDIKELVDPKNPTPTIKNPTKIFG